MTHSRETLHPGRILLLQAMEPLGISRNQLARDIDVPVGRISDITNGKRGITADTALRLGRYFGTGPELWLRLQAEFDLYVARMTTWPAVESRVRVLKSEAPVDDMPAVDEVEIEDEIFVEADLEPLAGNHGEEPGPESDPGTAGQLDRPENLSKPESLGEELNSTEDQTEPSQTVQTVTGDVETEPATDSEQELGIPPIPDRSKSFLSG